MSERTAPAEPDAGWATVCFGVTQGGGAPSGDGLDDRSFSGVWRSDAAHGAVLVRFDRLRTHANPFPCSHTPGPLPCDVHLWAAVSSRERTQLAEHADVLVSCVPLAPESADRRVREMLADHPGCLVAAVPGADTMCVVGVRRGTGAASVVRLDRGGADIPIPPHLVVSVAHAWVASGESPCALRSVDLMPHR
ncbi:hypothetical protein [Streptomyces sp. NPDC046821]|uniref:hypothetical protein n=1 Tax=Streptomyces sp. NPDC046821 TaxID=3154702 RepID=UPI0033D4D1F0